MEKSFNQIIDTVCLDIKNNHFDMDAEKIIGKIINKLIDSVRNELQSQDIIDDSIVYIQLLFKKLKNLISVKDYNVAYKLIHLFVVRMIDKAVADEEYEVCSNLQKVWFNI